MRASQSWRGKLGLFHCFPPVLQFSLPVLDAYYSQVADWARQHFQDELEAEPREAINLAKLCMLIALEEEAAEALYGLSDSRQSNNSRFHRVFFPERLADRCSQRAHSLIGPCHNFTVTTNCSDTRLS